MRRVFGKIVVGSLLLALTSVMCWAQTPKSEAVRDSSGAAADVASTNATIVQTVTGATLHLADAVADLDEKNLDSARSKIVLAVEAMRELTAALWSEQDKADPLTRDLEAARAEVVALKPQAAAQASLIQERQKAEILESLVQEIKRLVQETKEEARERDLQAVRAEVASRPAGSGQNGPTKYMLTANRAPLGPSLEQSVRAQGSTDAVGRGGTGASEHASAGSIVIGVPEVVNNATLRIKGLIVRLIGVEPAPNGEREQMARYLGDRTVKCWPVSSSVRHRCDVDGKDLSRVVLYNGGGRATSEATPDLLADEKRARSARIGIWRE